ncbi:MAG: metallophosphoesterase family protein [Nitrospinales bacterium]
MRLAIISDIHSNMEAFQQTLADIKNSGVDLIVNLGNSVGYPKHIITHFDDRRIIYFGKLSQIIDDLPKYYTVAYFTFH